MNLSHNRKMEAYVDAVNLINSNAAWASTYLSGPTFGFTTNPFSPRIFQIGGSFEF